MDSQVAKKNQSLTTAEEMRNQTKLVMQPYANWEEYLTPAPLSMAILGELVFISSKTDFSINKNPPKDGYKYIRYPDSFRACLMQVCNSGWWAFNEAHKNMDQIRLHTMAVPDYIKMAVKILFQGSDVVVETLLNHQLKSISVIADDCLKLANATEKRFTDVINIIHELLEACKNAQCFYGEELENIKKKLEETKLRKDETEKAVKASEKEVKTKEEDVKEAQETLENKLNSLPSASELMDIFTSLIFLFSRSSINFCLEQHRAHLNMTRDTYEKSVEKMKNNQKELTDILITMRTCNIEEIDFNTTIDVLVKGMDAMGTVKKHWEKMVRFFQMVSNIVKIRLTNDFKGFVTTSDTTQLLPHNEKLFCKDLLYNQAIQATNIVSLVNLLSTTYTEVSTKHLMDHATSLGELMTMDKEKPEFIDELEKFRKSCDEAQKAILELVLQNKEEFEKDSVANLEKLDQELLAILPDDDAKEERSINATESGFKE